MGAILPSLLASLAGSLYGALGTPAAHQTIGVNAAGTAWALRTPGWLDRAQTWTEVQTMSAGVTIGARFSVDTGGRTRFDDGSVANPGAGFFLDSDTGFYRTTANTLGISTAGVSRMFFDASGNVGIGTADQFGSATKVVGIANATVVPSTNPTGGGVLYSEGGAGKWRGSSGTVTTFAPAEPHCPNCNRDFMHEWRNDRYGYLAVCMWCLTEEIGKRDWIIKDPMQPKKPGKP